MPHDFLTQFHEQFNRANPNASVMRGEMPLGGLGSGLMGAIRGLRGAVPKVARPTMDLVERAPVAQVMPTMQDVDALLGGMKYSLAKIPRRVQPAIQSLGERVAEYTPVGGESLYNMGRSMPRPSAAAPMYDELVAKYLGKLR